MKAFRVLRERKKEIKQIMMNDRNVKSFAVFNFLTGFNKDDGVNPE